MSNQEVVTPAPESKAKTSGWDWLLPSITAVVIVKLFGLIGGLVAFGLYYWLKPKLGVWGAIAVAGVVGAASAIGLGLLIRPDASGDCTIEKLPQRTVRADVHGVASESPDAAMCFQHHES